jgi:hypothetical protein
MVNRLKNLKNHWHLGVAGLLMAVLGAAATLGFSAVTAEEVYSAEGVSFIYNQGEGTQDTPAVYLPLLAGAAKSAGWVDGELCSNRWGRPHGKFVENEPDPLLLWFGGEPGQTDGQLIGINLYSAVEQPAPWEYLPDGITTAIPGRGEGHYSLSIYVMDVFATDACIPSYVGSVICPSYGCRS